MLEAVLFGVVSLHESEVLDSSSATLHVFDVDDRLQEADLPDFSDLTVYVGQKEAFLNEEKYASKPLVVSDSIKLHDWFDKDLFESASLRGSRLRFSWLRHEWPLLRLLLLLLLLLVLLR